LQNVQFDGSRSVQSSFYDCNNRTENLWSPVLLSYKLEILQLRVIVNDRQYIVRRVSSQREHRACVRSGKDGDFAAAATTVKAGGGMEEKTTEGKVS